MQLQIIARCREVVQKNDGALTSGEEVLESQHLTTIAQRVLRQQSQFGQAIEHYARRVQLCDPVEDELGRFAELHFSGMQDCQLSLRIQRRFRRYQLEDVDALERPSMSSGYESQFLRRFRQRDVKDSLAAARAFHEKLQGKRRFAAAGLPLVEVHAIGVESTA